MRCFKTRSNKNKQATFFGSPSKEKRRKKVQKATFFGCPSKEKRRKKVQKKQQVLISNRFQTDPVLKQNLVQI